MNICAKRAVRETGVRVPGVRYASHKAQGAVNKAKDGPGKRLGAKKSGEQYVIPGNIIFRQRGTHWFPGENCGMGRDHTIYATESGYVKYYKDPEKHPKRQYIGVVFERDMVLPRPRNAVRRRRLGMVAQKMDLHTSSSEPTADKGQDAPVSGETELGEVVQGMVDSASRQLKEPKGGVRNLTLRPGYMYREANWEIGRAAERAKVKVRQYKPRDRWTAWRKTAVRKLRNAERKGMSRRGGKAKK
ncbi:MAG: 54S ribosomal protein L2 mitochondrial [Claussenomyces sp. TS43310]|nr:MAG: 54S ribosomal protein L2 mitochondrial [Claussenomyces sp. TS43310]